MNLFTFESISSIYVRYRILNSWQALLHPAHLPTNMNFAYTKCHYRQRMNNKQFTHTRK